MQGQSKKRIGKWGGLLLCLLLVMGLCAGIQLVRNTPVAVVSAAEDIAISDSSIIISKGDTYSLSVTGTKRPVSWRVNRKSVATVTADGKVKGVAAGTTTVIATVDGQEYRCTVRVEAPALNKTKLTARCGGSAALTVSGTKRAVTWRSSDAKIVKVYSTGKMSFLKPGTATITATVGKTKLTCKVTVNTPLISIPAQIKLGETGIVDCGGKKYQKLSFASSDSGIIEVDKNGVITAKMAGSADITVKIANYVYSAKVQAVNSMSYAVCFGNTSGLGTGDAKIAEAAYAIYNEVITEEMSDIEKIRAIHDYIVLNTEYAYEELLDGSVYAYDYFFSPEGVLLYRRAVCQGYAETMELFLNAMGIENQLITGDANSGDGWISHAWNLVRLDGDWYHLDSTWDDPLIDGKDSQSVYYDYFMKNDADMKKDHRWMAENYPAAAGGEYSEYIGNALADKYRLAGKYLESVDDYAQVVAEHYQAGETTIELMYPGSQPADVQAALNQIASLNPGRRCSGQWTLQEFGQYTILTIEISVQ